MDDIDRLVAALQQHTPSMQISSDIDILQTYAIDGVFPRVVVTPDTVEQVAGVVQLVSTHGLTLIARGGGSHIHIGGIPEHIDVLIETRALTHLLEHEAADLTCHCEAGMTLAELQTQLAQKGQFLALDPPGAQEATLGGILAANASGPKRLRYGSARDQVIGLKVVQASGEIVRSGGRVVKNVAGYDLNKLYIGSMGTLGIIVEANFKLQPLPQAERTLLLTFLNPRDAMHMTTAILNSLLLPSAIELIDAHAASDMNTFFGLSLPANGYLLAVNFEGVGAAVDRQIDETQLLARNEGALLGEDLTGEVQERFWQVIREHTQGTVTCKVATLVSHVAAYIEKVAQVCSQHDLEAAIVAHAGSGILYVELRPGDAFPRLVQAMTQLRAYAQETRGSLVVEHCPVELKRLINVWGEPGTHFSMMQRIKQQLDPKDTFVRGRFVGGL